ncbi:hypothetical protein O6H91_03G020000 [Diphasiastrum complanatum]|uniref:Uncharacterized protein n=1 Tax=Diphasiastrum complanatum TaxID=34168 RepID=A0ACC2E456_DIPCM|nr:hypothetical protein O6H91_03G020000 [Diphasiastrum complanatum]
MRAKRDESMPKTLLAWSSAMIVESPIHRAMIACSTCYGYTFKRLKKKQIGKHEKQMVRITAMRVRDFDKHATTSCLILLIRYFLWCTFFFFFRCVAFKLGKRSTFWQMKIG